MAASAGAQADIRESAAQARSTDTFGRVQCTARNHYFIVDGPVQNGCPGEAVTPGELFVSAIAACGVELVAEVIVGPVLGSADLSDEAPG